MIGNILLVSILIFFGIGFSLFLIIQLAVEFVKDVKGDKVGEQIKTLEDNGYQVEVEKGTLYILLDPSDYYDVRARKKVSELMSNYSKSYGIRLKEDEDELAKAIRKKLKPDYEDYKNKVKKVKK